MKLLAAEIWQAGKRVTGCHVLVDAHGVQFIIGTDVPIPDGDYELKRDRTVQKLTYANRQWLGAATVALR